ncbi:tail fiber assembly protein [Serratia sp. PF2-63]|uniref:tail fiber assembly protein n=1 Tax=Serratia TaxID=613 RepID=UPI00217A7C9F|nr:MULTISPECIES: tail fiber assembly protein [Serratia]MDI6932148.1 tail fiber assembly protein [Serratia sp. Se-PFBMAAmG]MDI6973364.1 tail fiber assembly protein [Serratia sp. Se-RSBMAAmG]MDI9262333.1 tail fiber assembly protein [Serratia sp. PF2-63]MDI9271185.1 tail fiber assembly protein [Serratia sp. PF-27]CAI1534333.1 Caudovirales tail fibre assembly protein [Serratia marcescens]
MRMNNFTRYTPDKPAFGALALYLQDEKGRDWYSAQAKFTKKYKLAILPETGVIRSITQDVSALFPEGLTVVDIDTLPDGCNISGDWVYNNGSIRKDAAADVRAAIAQKGALMTQASNQILVLADAVDLGMASEEDKITLEAWRTYRVLLSRVDIAAAPVIDWPEAP